MEEPIVARGSYVAVLEPWLGKPVIKVLTGMRRVGKSSILRLLAERRRAVGEEPLYFDMESLEHEKLRNHRAFHDHVKQLLAAKSASSSWTRYRKSRNGKRPFPRSSRRGWPISS